MIVAVVSQVLKYEYALQIIDSTALVLIVEVSFFITRISVKEAKHHYCTL